MSSVVVMTETPSKSPVEREKLRGWIPPMASPGETRAALEKAFDYRGDITITLRGGSILEGYVFDRRLEGPGLDQCFVRVLPKDRPGKITISFSDIVRLEFTGRDAAEGKSFELWVQRYREKKALGEKNISLEPEPLD